MAPITVTVIGATGRTGSEVVNGLLALPDQFIVKAITRQSSLNSEANESLRARGVAIDAVDLQGPKEEIVKVLKGVDVVVSCIVFTNLFDQIPLAEAAKEAGVKRFVPCNWGTPSPRGVHTLNDWKHDVLEAIQKIGLPYTVIDVGWWSAQIASAFPLPSGRTSHAITPMLNEIAGDGEVKCAFTHLPDIGHFTAKIIVDERTLNNKVLMYTDLLTWNEVKSLVEEVSGEKPTTKYVSAEDLEKRIAEGRAGMAKDPTDQISGIKALVGGYLYSFGIRGDNTPESAKKLGYEDFKKLYPDAKGVSMREVFEETLKGGNIIKM